MQKIGAIPMGFHSLKARRCSVRFEFVAPA